MYKSWDLNKVNMLKLKQDWSNMCYKLYINKKGSKDENEHHPSYLSQDLRLS